jgi:hypothetical protein
MVKRTKGTKVKILFQGLHMTSVVFVLVYSFESYILGIWPFRNGAHLVKKRTFEKIKSIHFQALNVLNMQKKINLCQVSSM